MGSGWVFVYVGIVGRVMDGFIHMDICDWLQMDMFVCLYVCIGVGFEQVYAYGFT